MWSQNIVKARVPENTPKEFKFEYLGNKQIDQVKPSCGCTATLIQGNVLKAKITPGLVKYSIPQAIYEKGKHEYMKNTSIEVYFDDNTVDVLKLELNVYEDK